MTSDECSLKMSKIVRLIVHLTPPYDKSMLKALESMSVSTSRILTRNIPSITGALWTVVDLPCLDSYPSMTKGNSATLTTDGSMAYLADTLRALLRDIKPDGNFNDFIRAIMSFRRSLALSDSLAIECDTERECLPR